MKPNTMISYETPEDIHYLRQLLKEDLERLKEVERRRKFKEEQERLCDDMLEFLRT
jgi:hypothetical protein